MFETKAGAERHIRFHYDRSNEFYGLFLDSRMVYSCAYFRSPDATLEDAQAAKLDHIRRKLDLKPGEQFLDVGCGWGALSEHAAAQNGAEATGCTLSHAQHAYAAARLEGRARVLKCDYPTAQPGNRRNSASDKETWPTLGPCCAERARADAICRLGGNSNGIGAACLHSPAVLLVL